MAVAPLPNVRRVVEYALTEIPAEKLWLGCLSTGTTGPSPLSRAAPGPSPSPPRRRWPWPSATAREIQYDQQSQAPWFRYTDEYGGGHEVWFEDARSIQAKLALVPEYGLDGVGYWNLNRPFPQNWRVLNALYRAPGAADLEAFWRS